MIKFNSVQVIKQFLIKTSACCKISILIKIKPSFVSQQIQNHIYRTTVKCNSFTRFFERNIAKTSKVKTIIIFTKQESVANRNQRCTLPTQSYIKTTEIADCCDSCCCSNTSTAAQLKSKSVVRLVKYGMPVRCYDFCFGIILFYKNLTQVA